MNGQVLNSVGMMHQNERVRVVHLKLANEEKIPSHDHIGEEVFFTLINGKVVVMLDGSEAHTLSTGEVLHFEGEHAISAEAQSESEVIVYLVKKS